MFTQTLFTKKLLNSDNNEHMSEQSVHFMLNGDIMSTGTKGSHVFIQNQLSNELDFNLNGKKICGEIRLDRNQFTLFFEGGEIGLYDSDLKTYTPWASALCLNLKQEHWVTGVYKYIKGDRWNYFVDGTNSIRAINIDKPAPGEYDNCRDCGDTPNTILDCDRIKLFRNFNIPKLKLTETEGNLPGASYQVAIRFTENQIGISEYYIYSQALKFHTNYNKRFGLKLDFDCFDTDYEEYEIVLIANRADRATVAQSIGFFDVSVRNVIISELDNSKYHPVDSSNLLEIKPYYQSAAHIASNNEHLILGSVKTRPPVNYHPQAFNIRSKWVSVRVTPENAHKHKSYLRDEVYSHNIRWIYKDGERTNWFHIKPHALDTNYVTGTIDAKDNWDDCGTPRKYWEVYNTATVTGGAVVVAGDYRKYKITLKPTCQYFDCTSAHFATSDYRITYINCYGTSVTITVNNSNSNPNLRNDKFFAKEIVSVRLSGTTSTTDYTNLLFGTKDPSTGLYSGGEATVTPSYGSGTVKYKDTAKKNRTLILTTNDPLIAPMAEFCAEEGSVVVENNIPYDIVVTACTDTTTTTPADCTLYQIEPKKICDIVTGAPGLAWPGRDFCIKYTDCNGAPQTKTISDNSWSLTRKPLTSITFFEDDCVTPAGDGVLSDYDFNYTSVKDFPTITFTYVDCKTNQSIPGSLAPDGTDNIPLPVMVCTKSLTFDNNSDINAIYTSRGKCTADGGGGTIVTGRIECDDYTLVSEGKFGYWESTLTYPDLPEFGTWRCKPIQYHKFPDNRISPHHGYTSLDACRNIEHVDILTIQFDNIEYPKDANGVLIPDIVGYEIGVTDRVGNKSIIHKGLLYNMREEPLENCETGYYANYPFNDLNEDVFIGKKWTYNPIANLQNLVNSIKETTHEGLTAVRRDMFSYISPDINFVRNDQGAELHLYEEAIGEINGKFSNTEEVPKFSIVSSFFYFILSTLFTLAVVMGIAGNLGSNSVQTSFDTLRIMIQFLRNALQPLQHALNYFARSNYLKSDFANIVAGNKRRRIEFSQFLSPTKQLVNGLKINNYEREASLLVKIQGTILDPNNKELSRFTAPQLDCTHDFSSCSTKIGDKSILTSSYYAGIKNYKPNQYGDLYSANIDQVTDIKTDSTSGIVFGGDVYITKHKQIKKLPFFLDIPKGLNTDEYFRLSDRANVGIPRYYADHVPENDLLQTFLSVPGVKLIGGIISQFKTQADNRPFHFDRSEEYKKKLCEDIISNCMNAEFLMDNYGGSALTFVENLVRNSSHNLLNVQGSFYTHAVGVVEYWCESEFIADFREINNIPQSNIERSESDMIKYDTILYPELFLYDLAYLAKPIGKVTPFHKVKDYEPNILDDYKVPFSLKDDIESGIDNWRIFKPVNYHQFTPADGKMTTIHSVNDYNLMFAFENAIYVTQSDDGLITAQGASTFLGSGSIFQRRMKRLSDEQTGYCGSVDKYSFSNSRFGTIWVDRPRKRVFLYNGKLDDITDGLEAWFNIYLPSTTPTNYFNSVRTIFDNFTKNYYLTLNNGQNENWTVSYKPEAKAFISFHSFTPMVYLQLPNTFLTIDQDYAGIWRHNKLYDYQTYYGKFYKFDVGYVVVDKFKKLSFNSLEIYAQFFKELGYNTSRYLTDVFFNKFCVYNTHVSTGIQTLEFKNPNKIKQQIKGENSEVTEIDSHTYRINDLRNFAVSQAYNGTLLIQNNGPMDYTLFNYDHSINPSLQGNIQGKTLNIHFINDVHNLKILMKYGLYNMEDVKQ